IPACLSLECGALMSFSIVATKLSVRSGFAFPLPLGGEEGEGFSRRRTLSPPSPRGRGNDQNAMGLNAFKNLSQNIFQCLTTNCTLTNQPRFRATDVHNSRGLSRSHLAAVDYQVDS